MDNASTMVLRILIGLTLLVNIVLANDDELFPLSIIHINDFHARFEPTDSSGGTCDDGEVCIGGYARTVYTVRRLLEEQKAYNPVYINAGDSFQGTLWYNIGRWQVTSEFLNMLPAEAMTLGNHEFDHGVEGCVPFLDALNTTMLVANMDATNEPTMSGKYKKSTIIERSGRKIGLIGVILETTYDLANTGNLIFRNESDTIREEAEKLKADGANIIIVISHCGYDVDKLIAKHAGDEIDVIVGAHSHTFLFTGDKPPGPDTPRGDYPTEVIHEGGHRVLIVQAAAYARYVGNITVFFDENGDVVRHEGAPIYMGNDVPEDKAVLNLLPLWREVMSIEGSVPVGTTLVNLTLSNCGYEECNLGNFQTDAMIFSQLKAMPYNVTNWNNVTIAFISRFELLTSLPIGVITYAQVFEMTAYDAPCMLLQLRGQHLRDILEYSVAEANENRFLQVAGLKVSYNMSAPSGERVVDVRVRCANCALPSYEPLAANEIYKVITTRYLALGNLGYTMLLEYGQERRKTLHDLAIQQDYIVEMSPIFMGIEKRITIIK